MEPHYVTLLLLNEVTGWQEEETSMRLVAAAYLKVVKQTKEWPFGSFRYLFFPLRHTPKGVPPPFLLSHETIPTKP